MSFHVLAMCVCFALAAVFLMCSWWPKRKREPEDGIIRRRGQFRDS